MNMALLGTTILLNATSVQAEETEKKQQPLHSLEPLLIVGDWLGDAAPEDVRRHPGARHVLRREQIEASGVSTIKDAIRQLPGVQVPENNGTGSGDFSLNIGLRGLGSRLTSRATVLLDGVPMANAPYGQPQLSLAPISLGNLEAIDVVKGGSAVRYGPQNVGGVINFVTKPIPNDYATSITVRGDLYDGDAGGTGKGTVNLSTGGKTEDGYGAMLLYSGLHGEGIRDNHQQDIDDVMIKYEIPAGANGHIKGRFHRFQTKNDLPGPLSADEFRADPFQSTHSYEKVEGDRTEFTAKYVNNFHGGLQLEAGAFVTDSFREFILANGNDSSLTRLDRLPREYRVYGFEPRFSGLAQTGEVDHEWSVGYRYIREFSNERRMRRTVVAGGDPFSVGEVKNRDTDGATRAHALYLDNRMDWNDWSMTPGMRAEWVHISRNNKLSDFKDKESYREFLPSLNVSYQLNPDTLLYANYNESFAAVGHLALSTKKDTSLDPERSRTYEIGTRFEGGNLKTDLTLFLINFDNQIEFDSTVGQNINKGETEHKGMEIAFSYNMKGINPKLEGLSVYGTYAYTDARRESGDFNGNDLRLYSTHTGTIGSRYQYQDWTFNVSGYAQSQQYSDDANTSEESNDGKNGIIPGFAILDFRAAKSFDWDDRKLEIGVGVKNIFDRHHFTRASIENNGGIFVGAPRTIFAELKTIF